MDHFCCFSSLLVLVSYFIIGILNLYLWYHLKLWITQYCFIVIRTVSVMLCDSLWNITIMSCAPVFYVIVYRNSLIEWLSGLLSPPIWCDCLHTFTLFVRINFRSSFIAAWRFCRLILYFLPRTLYLSTDHAFKVWTLPFDICRESKLVSTLFIYERNINGFFLNLCAWTEFVISLFLFFSVGISFIGKQMCKPWLWLKLE